MNESDTHVIWSWALHHCSSWLGRSLNRQKTRTELYQFNRDSTVGYVFDISEGQVRLLAKPDELDHIERNASGGLRSEFYRKFLQDVVDAWLPQLNTTLCISMCDGGAFHPHLPTFCFQKLAGHSQILLPDFDFLWKDFYEGQEFEDSSRFEDKRDSAVFVGATTGVTITQEVARALSSPRLDAARFFHLDPDVHFKLPVVVQCESDAVHEMISNHPFCVGDPVPWQDQLQYKYLISMDGNGATCSRVALSLKSNSALLKYQSPWHLYYFDFMTKNVHYIDIKQHQDVQDVISTARRWPGIFAPAARAGREFAERFLDRISVQFYMAALLALYDNSILESERKGPTPQLDAIFENLVGTRVDQEPMNAKSTSILSPID
jgi:hypothetical protein